MVWRKYKIDDIMSESEYVGACSHRTSGEISLRGSLRQSESEYEWGEHMGNIAEWVFLAEGCQVIGDVEIGESSSVWYNAVIRGDSNKVVIGENTNIQDNAVLHVSNDAPLTIGDNVTVGHGAILHGCTIGNNVLIGMGAIVLDGAVIEDNCMIGAGTLVTQNKVIPEGYLALGSPVKLIRALTEEEKESILKNANRYADEAGAILSEADEE